MDIRDEIINRSERLFLRLGVRSVSMDDISSQLGISKKTLYQHFENKDALVEAVISTHSERKQCTIEQLCGRAKDALDEIRQIGAFITASIEDASPSALYDLQKYYRKSWELLTDKRDERVAVCIRRNIERGIAEGLYRSDLQPEIIAKLYARLTQAIIELMADVSAAKFSRQQMIWELHNYHIHGIANVKGLKQWEQYSSEMKFYEGKNFERV
ncbi:MAG: TetR/AcrR family transcriptional regulator [Bacteroidota bacterium]